MNRIFTLFFLFLIGMTATSWKQPDRFSLVGKWEGGTGTKKGVLIFRENGELEMHSQGRTPIRSNEKGTVSYVFDASKSPAWLDIVIVPLGQAELEEMKRLHLPSETRMLGIVEIVNDNEIRLQLNHEVGRQQRPVDTDKNAVVFKRFE